MTYSITPKQLAADNRLLTALRGGRLSCSVLRELLSWNHGATNSRLWRLERSGRVVSLKTNGRTYWQLPGALRLANTPQNGKTGVKVMPRTYEFKPLANYDLDAHRRLAMVTR